MLIKTNTFKTHVITTKDHLNGFGLITIEAHGLRNSSDSICNKNNISEIHGHASLH